MTALEDLLGHDDGWSRELSWAVAHQARREHDRLEAEAADLLAEGHSVDDLEVVRSPLCPRGRVMTKAQVEEHVAELRDASPGFRIEVWNGERWWR
jgi:hypothetical protein